MKKFSSRNLNIFFIEVCATHKRKLCHECHLYKICAGKKECNVFKNAEYEDIINQGMESIDKKIQEAIEDINAHGERIRNMFKKDPINYKVDDNWKLNLKISDILMQEQNEESAQKNETTKKSVPLKNSPESEGSQKLNRTLRISNLDYIDDGEYSFRANFINGQSYTKEQSNSGKNIHFFKLTELKQYLR